eukprot:425801_1
MIQLLDTEGPWGAEKAVFHLNEYYFERVVKIVSSEGGDILKFAGDSMIIIWKNSDSDDETKDHDDNEEYGKTTTNRAIQCGLNIQKELQTLQSPSGVTLSVKIGIGVGKCKIIFVGGILDRCEYSAVGEPFSQAFLCEYNAKPGQVVIHRAINQNIDADAFQTKWIDDSDCFQVVKQLNKIQRKTNGDGSKNKSDLTDTEMVKRLNQFIPQVVKTRLVHHQDSRMYRIWHQESRIMTVLHINVDFLAIDKLPISILQQILEVIQCAIYRYEGSLNKLMYSDKGATVVAVFGLPPVCNFDDAARGLYAAFQIERVLKSLNGIPPELPEHAEEALKLRNNIANLKLNGFQELKVRISIGVASDRGYCGLLGCRDSRCEYGIFGDLVNLSAQLMQHAGKPKEKGGLGVNRDGVLCSEETKRQCDDCRIQFKKLTPIQVKGKSNPIEVFRPFPNWNLVLAVTSMQTARYSIGFYSEYDVVEEAIKEMFYEKGEAYGAIICVEGHHWYGGTHFAAQITARLKKYIYVVCTSAIKYEEQQVLVWQALMAAMAKELHLSFLISDDESNKHLIYKFFSDTGMEGILPAIWIVNDLLGTKFHVEPEEEASIKPEKKKERKTTRRKSSHTT